MCKSMLLAAVAVICGAGCVGSQTGDGGKLRFGQVYQFAESTDFTTAIAVGQPMPLGLQASAKAALLNDYGYLDGTLQVTDATGAKLDVHKVTAGKFQTEFPKAGSYTLTGTNAGITDTLTVTAADQAGLRLAKKWYLSGSGKDPSCKPAQPAAGQLPVLKGNQQLSLSVIPQTAKGEPLLGILDLKMEVQGVQVSRNAAFEVGSYTVSPDGQSTHGVITFTDQKTHQSVKVELELAPTATELCKD